MYSTLLVADEESSIVTTTTSFPKSPDQDEKDIENLFIITDLDHKFEQKRRAYGNIPVHHSDQIDSSDSDTKSSDNFDLDVVLPSNEDHSSIRFHGSGPLKLYLKEHFSHWPQQHYRKHQKRHMAKHEIPINYGSIHTKQIQSSLKQEEIQRKRIQLSCVNLRNMFEEVSKSTAFLSLDHQNPLVPIPSERLPPKRSTSKLREMKKKFHKT